jgi:hypothetical protein
MEGMGQKLAKHRPHLYRFYQVASTLLREKKKKKKKSRARAISTSDHVKDYSPGVMWDIFILSETILEGKKLEEYKDVLHG